MAALLMLKQMKTQYCHLSAPLTPLLGFYFALKKVMHMYWNNKPKNFRKQMNQRYAVDLLSIDDISDRWNNIAEGVIA